MATKVDINKKEEKVPPDGGWGWMVVLGAALINTVNQALFSVYGLIFGETLKEMGGGTATGLTFVMAISVCMTNFSGLLVGPLMKRLSVMIITIFGVSCVSAGMIISSFATEMWHIAVGYGLFTGLGLGLVASSTFLAISEFFTTKKNTAVGLAMAGTSTGQMLMPIIVGILLKNFGFSGTSLTLGCLSGCGILGALLFKPILCCKRKTESNETNYEYNGNDNKTQKSNETLTTSGETKGLLSGETKTALQQETQSNENSNSVAITSTESLAYPMQASCLRAVIKTWDLHLLKDFGFIHMSLGLGLGYVSSISFSTIFPMFLQDEVNFSMWETTTCMTALSAADIIGRITLPEIFRRLKFGSSRIQFMIGGVVLAIFRYCLVSVATSYYMMMVFSLLCGYFRAITVINQNLVVSEYVRKDELPSAVGLNMFVKGFFVIAVGEPLGKLKDAFDYDVCINLLNVLLVFVVVSWSIEILIRRRSRKGQRQSVDTQNV